ncbi:hypothetical protein JCM10213_008383 [Rhodosporidiobolus nylandii]
MAAHKRRKAKLKQNKPLPSISKEQSCQTCRVRKIRCTQERPACQQCRKSAIARGHPAEGVRCHYSAASVFAKDGDAEFELELGGRERGCFWGDQPEGVEASTAAPGASIRDTPAFAEDDGREGVVGSPSPSPSFSVNHSDSMSPTFSLVSSASTPPSAVSPCTPVAFAFQPGSPPPADDPSPSSSRAISAPPLTPFNFSRATSPTPKHIAKVPIALTTVPLPPVPPPPSSLFLTPPSAPPSAWLGRPRSHTYPSFPASSGPADSAPQPSQAVAAVLPPVVKRDAAFWDGGPLSPEEINGWSGLLYAALSNHRDALADAHFQSALDASTIGIENWVKQEGRRGCLRLVPTGVEAGKGADEGVVKMAVEGEAGETEEERKKREKKEKKERRKSEKGEAAGETEEEKAKRKAEKKAAKAAAKEGGEATPNKKEEKKRFRDEDGEDKPKKSRTFALRGETHRRQEQRYRGINRDRLSVRWTYRWPILMNAPLERCGHFKGRFPSAHHDALLPVGRQV